MDRIKAVVLLLHEAIQRRIELPRGHDPFNSFQVHDSFYKG